MTAFLKRPNTDSAARQAAADPPVTDDPLRRDVERVLRASSHCELRQLTCQFADGVATLTGRVSSYYLKAIAQTIVRDHPGVSHVDNRLRVCDPRTPPADK